MLAFYRAVLCAHLTYTYRLTVRTPTVSPRKYTHTATALPRSSGSNTRTALPTVVESLPPPLPPPPPPLPAADRTATYTHTNTLTHVRYTCWRAHALRTLALAAAAARPVTNPSPCTRIPDDGWEWVGEGGGMKKKYPTKIGKPYTEKPFTLGGAGRSDKLCGARRHLPTRSRSDNTAPPGPPPGKRADVVTSHRRDYYRYYYCYLFKLSLLLLFLYYNRYYLFVCFFFAPLPVCWAAFE